MATCIFQDEDGRELERRVDAETDLLTLGLGDQAPDGLGEIYRRTIDGSGPETIVTFGVKRAS